MSRNPVYYQPNSRSIGIQASTKTNFSGFWTHHLAVTALILSVIIHGKLTDFLGSAAEDVRFFLIFFAVSINLIGIAVCTFRKMLVTAIISFFGLMGVFIYTAIFSINSGVPFTFSAGGEYFGYSSLAIFMLCIKDNVLGQVLRSFYFVCCVYAALYFVAYFLFQAGYLDLGGATRVFTSADQSGRNDRLQFSSMALVFGTTSALVRIFRSFNVFHTFALGIFLIDIYLTGSRVIAVILAAILLAYVFARNADFISRSAYGVYVVGTAFSLFLIFYPDYNPYYLTTDTSGNIRVFSVYLASDLINEFWLFGAGIAYGIEAYVPISGSKYFYPSDIGMIGILFAYGVLGFSAYFVLTYLSCTIYRPMVQLGLSRTHAEASALTGAIFALYSLQAAHFNSNESAYVLAMIALALKVSNRLGPGSDRERGRRSI
ncbi:MAG: hypothetical protein ACT6Q7_19810 [Blastomonas fulva]|uniref:hypothetical protein n=1 Tax=Blastomonas fulva TaxID=1550728 RepID=UPI004034E1BC